MVSGSVIYRFSTPGIPTLGLYRLDDRFAKINYYADLYLAKNRMLIIRSQTHIVFTSLLTGSSGVSYPVFNAVLLRC